MDYIEIHLNIIPKNTLVNDVLASKLGEIGFESFSESEDGMFAYIPVNLFNGESFNKIMPKELFGSRIKTSNKLVIDQNWNQEWEKNYFQPIVIGNDCVIHSSFHKNVPVAAHDILINPKMAFGTGHHETTSLMIGELIKLDVRGKSFLDMGCGTAVLAILATMKGAGPVLGIDIDQWAVENAIENIGLNHVPEIDIQLGGAELLEKAGEFDVLFANITRNILLNDMPFYVAKMHTGSVLYMSGFYETDIPLIQERGESLGLIYQGFEMKNNWVAVHFVKE